MLERVWIGSPNWSYRDAAGCRMIVLHTAEGARTKEDLGAFFQGDVGASSHVGIDDEAGVIAEYVEREDKAWTQANFNPACVSVELCAFAEWSAAEWAKHPNMLANAASWVAEEAAAFGIPLTRLSAAEAQGGSAGVCMHVDLGSGGGGHWDCGPAFPLDDVIEMAKGGSPAAPAPELSKGGDDMFIRSSDGRVRWAIYDGKKTYWRMIPVGAEQNVADRIVDDPNDTWLGLWDH
jgi:hypothetical protein